MFVQQLEWDSGLFGMPVGRLMDLEGQQSAESVLRQVRSSGCRVVYASSESLQPSLSNYYVLTQLKLQTSLAGCRDLLCDQAAEKRRGVTPCCDSRVLIERHHGPADGALRTLALQAGWLSRFRLDSRFGSTAFERLYACWVERSCAREIADVVLTASLGSSKVGFVTARLSAPIAEIGLVAVDDQSRGLGVGRQLMEHVAALAMDAGCRGISVVTQAENVSAVRLYSRVGFEEVQRLHWYHLWCDSGDTI